jgi:hypothetical protein
MWITYVVLLSLAAFLMFYLLWQAERKDQLLQQNRYLKLRLANAEKRAEGRVNQIENLPKTTSSLDQFWKELSKWSQDTFGSDGWRGPTGPLQHLAKEVQETLQDPVDIIEYADMLFLVFDACRRAGFDYPDLEKAVWHKLNLNRKRSWSPPSQEGISEHHREVA